MWGHSSVDCLLSMHIYCCDETTHGKITKHYSRFCAVAFCYVHNCKLSYMSYILSMMLNCIRTECNYKYRIGCVWDLAWYWRRH